MNFWIKTKKDTTVGTTDNTKTARKEGSKISRKFVVSLFKNAIRKRNLRHIGKVILREESINCSTESIQTSETEPTISDDGDDDGDNLKLEDFHFMCNKLAAPLKSCLRKKRHNEEKGEMKQSMFVRFNPAVMMLLCEPISEILDGEEEELSKLFWSAKELAKMRMATLVMAQRASNPEYHFSNNVCLRGLEPQINCVERHSIIGIAIQCVLVVQELQNKKGTYDETQIALTYILASKESLHAAAQQGTRDEQEAFGQKGNKKSEIIDQSKVVARAA